MRIEPRWLDAAATADYIYKRVGELPRLVKEGRLPPPSYEFGPKQPRWDRLAIDSKMAGQAASAVPDQMSALAQRMLQRR